MGQFGLSVKLIVLIILIEFSYQFQYTRSTGNPVGGGRPWRLIKLRHSLRW